MKQTTIKKLFAAGLVLYLLCLALDGYYVDGNNPRAWATGIGPLLIGWVTGELAWWANPVLFSSWIAYRARAYVVSAGLAIVALIFALSFLWTETIIVSEAPHYAQITGYGFGYWAWIASMVVTMVCSLLQIRNAVLARKKRLAEGPKSLL